MVDLGGYIQNVMLLARGYGLHTCAQEAWTHWHKHVPRFLGTPDTMLFCGMAIGYADESGADQFLASSARAAGRIRDAFQGFCETDRNLRPKRVTFSRRFTAPQR